MTDPIQQQLMTARKNQILDAAAVVFAEKGFHPATTKDIAKQAGISEGTIYNYFTTKPALLLGIFDRMRTTTVAENTLPVSEDFNLRTALQALLYHPLMALKEDNSALFRIVVSEMMVNEELRSLYYQQILEPTLTLAERFLGRNLVRQGHNSLSVSLTVRAISGMVLGLMMEYIIGDPTLEDQWEQLPDFLANLLLKGLEADQTQRLNRSSRSYRR